VSGGGTPASISLGGDHPTLASLDAAVAASASASSSHLATTPTLPRGTALGRYTVLEPVGRGGMGTVYAAYDPQLDRKVAIKVLRPRGGRPPRPRDRARLLREAQAMARLSHPNVIAVHDVAEWQGEIFVAMEFVDGGTLKRWLADESRRWDEIRDVFVAAGEGLAAAHAAGLVHRDFKPDNVLIDHHGRVRVTDFGLARHDIGGAPHDDDVDLPSEGSPLSDPLTQVGALVGTPAFMAPEQHARLGVEPRTDQFSFCVALYQALYGQHPFSGTTVAELAAAVTMGQVKEPARDTSVPAPIRRAVLRGLSRLPEDRWPTMNELLDALRFDPRRRLRRLALAGAGLTIALVAGGSVYATLGSEPSASAGAAPTCDGAGSPLDAIWNEERRAEIGTAFTATGRPLADAAFSRAARIIDEYAESWRAESQAACEATRVQGVQSDEMLDLRTACLRRRLDDFDAMLAVLERPDRALVEDAPEAAAKIVPVSVCADTTRLRGVQPLPDDPALQASASEAYRELASVRAQLLAGRPATVIDRGEALVERALSIAHPPLVAEAELVLGDLHGGVGNFVRAHELLDRAAISAAAARDDLLLTNVYTVKLDLLGRVEARYDDALLFAPPTEAAIERAGRPSHAVVQFRLLRGNAHLGAGRYPEARKDYQAALELANDATSKLPLRAAITNNLGAVDFAVGEFARARGLFSQALELHRELHGDLHPDVAECLYNIGNTLLEEGDVDQAIPRYLEALDVLRLVGAGPSTSEAGLRNSLAVAYFTTGRMEEARREAQLSLEQFQSLLGHDTPSRVAPLVVLAQLDVLDGHAERAEDSLREIIVDLRETFGEDHPHVGIPLAQLGRMQVDSGRLPAARVSLERAVQLSEGLMPTHPTLVPPLTDLARVERLEGDHDRAIELLERAVKIAHAGINDRWEAAYAIFTLAQALEDRDRPRALELGREAAALLEGVGERMSPTRADVEAWLAAHD
jgi:tetratricopeptide (TPR) repeat protein/predicted Ser/Thr protein kinase